MSWLSSILSPIKILLNGEEQTRDDRIDFRNGFTATQVPDADGINVLTIDTEVGAATVTPTADKVVKRNGSGAVYGTTMVATTFSYASPVTITRDEAIVVDYANMDPTTGWSINNEVEPESNDVGIEWRTEIKPPVGSVLQSFAARYTPPSGHMNLPDQPSIWLIIVDEDGTLTTYETPAQDNAADIAAYELGPRTITKTFATPLLVEADKRYIALFTSEDGADALSGLKLHRPARWTTIVTNL
jgi:hypothetical protein